MTTRRRKRHTPEQIVRKLRDADAMLNAGQDQAAVLQALEVSEATFVRWRNQYGGMQSEEAKRLKQLEEENKKLKELVADQALDIRMLKHLQQGNWSALPESEPPWRNYSRHSRSPSDAPARWWINPAAVSVTKRSLGATKRP
jgi:hypothetical protein